MNSNQDIRWQQRLNNYQTALARFNEGVALSKQRPLSNLEEQGLIQGFEFTHELAWNVMKDFLNDQDGGLKIAGSKDATRLAFQRELITHGEDWMEMIESRNLSSHTYDVATADKVSARILEKYAALFEAFSAEMESRRVA
jgi:nucleotidyltransferase substrate binding protein (TIGR01987 family)